MVPRHDLRTIVNTVSRLSSTKAGLKILDEAGIAAPRVEVSDGVQLTRDEREDIQVDPIPRNIHPVHHAGRRGDRARAIRSVGSDAKAALFVDAAEYSTRRAFGVSVVDGKGQLVARASVCSDQVTVAEEIAIALALQEADVPFVVYSDSRTAVRAFSGGSISQQAARILRSGRRQARWVSLRPLRKALELDGSNVTLQAMAGIASSHTNSNNFEKMRVPFAFQVFGDKVLNGLRLYETELERNCGSIQPVLIFFG
ncbi:hypothetical protein HPB50_007201 [Hyalomma asiaticum]|uniref:Uncharacterized protein n=1 Tax=Hyalomma asiaticum TaxID=266040 RepID=A0ACB7TDK9_HYAAI|nr:hypothetical protein HPB50_007201 [Hyalomma asiaticum]